MEFDTLHIVSDSPPRFNLTIPVWSRLMWSDAFRRSHSFRATFDPLITSIRIWYASLQLDTYPVSTTFCDFGVMIVALFHHFLVFLCLLACSSRSIAGTHRNHSFPCLLILRSMQSRKSLKLWHYYMSQPGPHSLLNCHFPDLWNYLSWLWIPLRSLHVPGILCYVSY